MADGEETQRSERRYSEIGPTGFHVGKRIAMTREDRGITTEQLAERLTAAGVPIKATTITKIEKARRRLTVDELVALAVALDTTPSALMLPVTIDREQPVEITGAKGPVTAQRAWRWLVGNQPLPGQMKGRSGQERDRIFQSTVRPWWLMEVITADRVEYDDYVLVQGREAEKVLDNAVMVDPEHPDDRSRDVPLVERGYGRRGRSKQREAGNGGQE